jgi:branched-chain amino acid transport system substrate-binding protein
MRAGTKTREPWRVGLLFSQSGPTAYIEQTQLNATLLAIDEINAAGGVAGREMQPIVYDPSATPELFGRLAERLLTEDRVPIIFGCYMSSSRKAVVPVVERRNALLAYPAMYEGFEYSPNVIYTGAAPNQNSIQLARFLVQNFGKRVYLVGTRYVFPIESNRIMTTFVTERRGEIVAERYVRLDSSRKEFDAIAADIKNKGPDVVFSTVVGEATALFHRACHDAGLDARNVPIASLTTTEAEIALMGADLAAGHLTAATYFQSVSGKANNDFVANYKARFGAQQSTNALAESAYFQTKLIAKGLEIAQNADPDLLRPALFEIVVEAPQGAVRLDADNQHCYLWPRIGRAEVSGEFTILQEAAAPIKPDPYLAGHRLDDWGPAVSGPAEGNR